MDSTTFAHRLMDVATTFCGLYETESNAAFQDAARSARLLKAMKRVPWWSPGAAYCAAFDGACVILTCEGLNLDPKGFLEVWTAHCMTNVRKMRELGLLSDAPVPGSLWLARHGSSDSGHAGITLDSKNGIISNIEGNTSAGATASAEAQRNGDGIYARMRNAMVNGSLRTQGWVHPEAILSLVECRPAEDVGAPAPPPKSPERAVVRVEEFLANRGYKRLLPQALKQSWSKYDPSLDYSVASSGDISNWLTKVI